MKRIALLFALLVVAGSAQAQAILPGVLPAASYVAYSNVPKNRRIAVINQSEFDMQGNWQSGKQWGMGLLIDRLRDTGLAEVYSFPSAYFYRSLTTTPAFQGTAQWHTLGDYFGVALVVGEQNQFNGSADGGAKFFCPESTNIQIVHVGDGSFNPWREFSLAGAKGVGCVPGEDAGSVGATPGLTSTTGPLEYVTTYTGSKDTLSGQSFPFRRASMSASPGFIVTGGTDSTHANVYRVVRLLKPSFYMSRMTKPNWLSGTPDSTLYEQWYSDSIVHGGELMPWAWRTYWKPAAGFAVADTPWVDYVQLPPLLSNRTTSAHIAWSVISRYVKLEPIKISLEWDDVGNMGLNPSTPGSAWGFGNPRWPNPTLMNGVVAWLDARGIRPVISGQADTLKFYGTVGADSAGGASRYYRYGWLSGSRFAFVNHVHDTTSTRYFSNPMGRGSQSGFGGAATRHIMGHSYSPSAWPWFGIYNKLAAMDSLHRTWNPNAVIAPYLSFANDAYLSTDWRMNTGGGQFGYCPPESMFKALVDAGKFYVRGYVSTQDSSSFAGNQTTGIGSRYFVYPGERFPVGNLSVTNVGTLNWAGVGTGLYADASAVSQGSIAALMGFTGDMPRLWVIQFQVPTNESATTTAWTALNRRNIGAVDRLRVWYQHPKNYDPQDTSGGPELHVLQFTVSGFRALNQLAGHEVVKFVQPWETYYQ